MTTTIRFRFLGCNAIARASFAGVGGRCPWALRFAEAKPRHHHLAHWEIQRASVRVRFGQRVDRALAWEAYCPRGKPGAGAIACENTPEAGIIVSKEPAKFLTGPQGVDLRAYVFRDDVVWVITASYRPEDLTEDDISSILTVTRLAARPSAHPGDRFQLRVQFPR